MPSDLLYRMFNGEVRKLLENRVDAIKGGYAPSWENHISVYQVEVPAEFGAQFRKIRNRTVHASTKRSSPGNDSSLGQFYEKYHGFVYLLYYSSNGCGPSKMSRHRIGEPLKNLILQYKANLSFTGTLCWRSQLRAPQLRRYDYEANPAVP